MAYRIDNDSLSLIAKMKAKHLRLEELMQFTQGRVAFHGRRLVLHDLKALGQFRRDLIEMMGDDDARRTLTRKGLFWGQADAAAMESLYRWDSTEEWLRAGPMLARIVGLAEIEMTIRELDIPAGKVRIEMEWSNSSEVEQHLAEMGAAARPICWVLVGYATGYVSYCTGKEVFFIENRCQAAGAFSCAATGRDVASWGAEIQPHLPFFHAADIRKRVEEMSRQLAEYQQELARQRRELESSVRIPRLEPVETRSPVFQRTLELAARVGKFDTTVLVTGETGSGKEVLARYIHRCSPRADKPLLAVNCSAFPEALLESELFGHRAGAFTGATRNHLGLFEEANGGTVFLDEIGDISPGLQAKLLRVIQEREVKRVGESHSRPVDVRVISATNQDLEKMVAEGRFREDLFYRFNVVRIRIPPLRERREDILPLADHCMTRCAERLRLRSLRLAPASVDALQEYSWPGNVRELENAIEHAAVMCVDGIITPQLLPMNRPTPAGPCPGPAPTETLEQVELAHIRRVLAHVNGNRAKAAAVLGVGQATLYRKLKQLKLPMNPA